MIPEIVQPGQWIAVVGGRVVGTGATPDQAKHGIDKQNRSDRVVVAYMPRDASSRIDLPDVALEVGACLDADVLNKTWVVGGAVRDSLLGRAISDVDFVISGDAIGVARRVAKSVEGEIYVLDEKRETARVIVVRENRRMMLDFARMRGETLVDDLLARDFTINAMAVPLSGEPYLLDPSGGRDDIERRSVESVTPYSLFDDPIRCVRAVRFAADLSFKLNEDTEQMIRRAAPRVSMVSAERVRDEFMACLAGTRPRDAVGRLAELDVIEHILPHIHEKRAEGQKGPKGGDGLWGDTLAIVQSLRLMVTDLDGGRNDDDGIGNVANELGGGMAGFAEGLLSRMVEEMVEGRPIFALMLLGVIIEGICEEYASGTVERTEGRSETGRRAEVCASAMRLSKREVNFVARLCGCREQVKKLVTRGAVSRLDIHKFYRDVGDVGVERCIVELARGRRMECDGDKANNLSYEESRLLDVLGAYFLKHEEVVAPGLMLDGDDVMRVLKIGPGPIVGVALQMLAEAQVGGEVDSKSQAMEMLPSLIERYDVGGLDPA